MWISEKLACFPNITAKIFFINVFTTLMLNIIVYNVCCNTELKPEAEDGNTYYRNIENNTLSLNPFWGEETIFLYIYVYKFQHSQYIVDVPRWAYSKSRQWKIL